MGIVRETKNPVYGSTAFTVPKKGPKKYRMVLNMKPLNNITKNSALVLPKLEKQFTFLRSAKIFASFDILSGFDFLETHVDSRKYFNIIVPGAAFEMIGAPMGWKNTPVLFQNRLMTEVLCELYGRKGSGCCQWIDDTLIYSENFNDFLEVVSTFLDRIIAKRVRLNIR